MKYKLQIYIKIRYLIILFIKESYLFANRIKVMDQHTKDIIAGFVSGWFQVFLMQPFEIVKIRLQTQSSTNPYYNGMVDCFKKIGKEEGLLSFYKGTLTPLIGIGFQASCMFFFCEFWKRYFSKFKENPNDRLSISLVALSAALASGPTSLIASPVEHARIRMQIQKGGASGEQYHGSVDAGMKIIKNHGIAGMYRGVLPTWGRECIGQIFYFSIYQSILRAYVGAGQKTSTAPLSISIVGGAFAGIGFWIFAYPFDYVKTMLQTDSLEKSKQVHKGMLSCFAKSFKEGGIGIYYKGLGVALYRAALVNAGAFWSFEGALRLLGRSQDLS